MYARQFLEWLSMLLPPFIQALMSTSPSKCEPDDRDLSLINRLLEGRCKAPEIRQWKAMTYFCFPVFHSLAPLLSGMLRAVWKKDLCGKWLKEVTTNRNWGPRSRRLEEQNYANNSLKYLDMDLHSLEPSDKSTALGITLVELCEWVWDKTISQNRAA